MKHSLGKRWRTIHKNLFLDFIQSITLDCGKLTVIVDEFQTVCVAGKSDGPSATITVHDDRFYPMVNLQGDIGLGEAYMERYYTTDNLVQLISFFIQNPALTGQGDGIIPSLQRLKDYIHHLLRDNRIAQGRKNIQAHYDIGNDFYQTFLDPSMMYSSAIFKAPEQSLEEAQYHKLDRLIAKAQISAKDHVLEIGSGWGSFAIRAATTRGCRVTTITLSSEQKEYVERKVALLGLEDKIEVKLIDYRLMKGQFDKIVSIEMIEAVGHRHLNSYLEAIESLLAPNGLVVIQMISMPDYRYNSYRKSVDWIRKHIFPGGHLPSLTAFSKAMEKNSRLHLEEVENIAPHYAQTLLHWHKNFKENSLDIAREKFDERFIRMWEYYLLSCSAAFSTRYINTLILTLGRDRNVTLDRPQERAEDHHNFSNSPKVEISDSYCFIQ